MNVHSIIDDAKQDFERSYAYLKSEYSKISTGKASPAVLENVQAEAYSMQQPLKSLSVISPQDSQTLIVKPFDKSTLKDLESAIQAANLGLNPTNMGEHLLVSFPPLTEERRIEIAKKLKVDAEEVKVSIRKARQKAQQRFKELESNAEISKDDLVSAEKKLQLQVDAANDTIEEILKQKQADIMKV